VDTLSYKTVSVNKANADKKWFTVDAEGENLGRLASRVAMVIRGKHKPSYTPHADCGDFVIILNADKVEVTGKKADQKEYIRHTNYPGGQRKTSYREMMEKHPERVLEKAVRGMLPKNKLGDALYRNLHVYLGTEHPHVGQQPAALNINTIK